MDDMLSYSAMSDMTKWSPPPSVDDMDGMVTITALGAGSATITVTASDPMDGESAMQTIMVTVAANMGPMAGEAIEVTRCSMWAATRSWSPAMFTDPEDDMLTYSAMSERRNGRHRHG